jgi:hypothetical protein
VTGSHFYNSLVYILLYTKPGLVTLLKQSNTKVTLIFVPAIDNKSNCCLLVQVL